MSNIRAKILNFIEELKRRRVLTTAAGYAVVAWILLQVAEVTFEPLHVPDWALTLLVIAVFVGFPVAMVLSWFFDITLKGLKKDTGSPVQRTSVLPAGPSVAVLAFDDMSRERDQDYLCEGIAEEILNRLAQIRSLRVASRTSSFRFKKKALDIGDIGKQLNVATVLEGSVRKSGQQLRITTQLINVGDGYHLWSQSYDRKLENIFEIQDEIATNVAAALEVKLAHQSAGNGTTKDVQAYDYYLQGVHFFHLWGARNVQYAIDMFTKAVNLDPSYARAWAALANCHSVICMYWSVTDSHLDAAKLASEQSLQLAPELAEAHVSRGLAHTVHQEPEDAVSEFKTAIEIDPVLFDAHYFYGRVCFQQGRLQQAAQLFEQAERVRPDDFQAPILLRQIYHALGQEDDAHEAAARGVRLAERHLELNPNDTRALNLGLGGLADLGDETRLTEWAERSLSIDGENADTLYNVACGYAVIGNRDKAIECLERATLRGSAIAQWAENDSDLASLKDDHRFVALMKRLKPPI